MADKPMDSESLEQAAAALSTYICEVQDNIQKMQDAAIDCSDNMGSDVYSQVAIQKLQDCIKELNKTLEQAEELRVKILNQKRKIEDSGSSI